MYSVDGSTLMRSSGRVSKNKHAEFMRRSGNMTPRGSLWKSPKSSPAWPNSPVEGVVTPSKLTGAQDSQDFYSTLQRTPNRKKFSKEEREDFTEQSTRQAFAEWASSPEFAGWIMKHADRIHLLPEGSSDEPIGSGSYSTDEYIAESSSGRGLLWGRHQ